MRKYMGWRIKEGIGFDGRRRYGIGKIGDLYEIEDFRYRTIALAKSDIRYWIKVEEELANG